MRCSPEFVRRGFDQQPQVEQVTRLPLMPAMPELLRNNLHIGLQADNTPENRTLNGSRGGQQRRRDEVDLAFWEIELDVTLGDLLFRRHPLGHTA